MPGLVAFGRRWSIGSDDLLLPSTTLFAVHVIWIGVLTAALAVDYGHEMLWPNTDCKLQSLGLLCTIYTLIVFSAILELCLVVVSLKGSILNDTPRSGVPYLLYIRLFALILEIIWSFIAIPWSQKFYWSCPLVLTKQAIVGLIIWVWSVLISVVVTAWCVFDVAGRSWVKMKRYQANVKEMEHRHPSFRRSGSTQRNWRQRKVMREYESSWNSRCRILFCCVHKSESSRDSFGELAKLLSEFFRDLDVVPSDIIVGLLLLRKLQRMEQGIIIKEKRKNTYEFLSGIAITPNTKFLAMNDAQDLEIYHNVVYYMRYASAAYGWLWYVIPNGFRGLFNLCSNVKCCFHRYLCTSLGQELSEKVVEDNCCFCNVAVIPTMFDPSTFDIVYATYHVDVGETPFFVVVDYEKQAIVVSIRGTLSLKDLITDLNAEAESLPLDPVREDWLGHKGMVQVATYLKSKLVGENILDRAFEMCQSRSNEHFDLIIVGHSLGGGAAAILAILLRDQFPTLRCYAYSPPGGLLSMPAVEYTKEFVTSVIVGKDLVPRIGLSQMEALRADLLNAIKRSRTPKWKTIMAGMKCCKCLRSKTGLLNNDSQASSTAGPANETSSASQKSFQEDLLSHNASVVSMSMHQPLYPPGRIMHIVRHHPKKDEIKYESVWRKILGKGEPVFQAIWTDNTDYDEVLISPGMIQDHMPDNVLKALSRVTTSLGPAKPQRVMTNNPSSSNTLDIVVDTQPLKEVLVERTMRLHSETSYRSSEASSGAGGSRTGGGANVKWVEPPSIICQEFKDVDVSMNGNGDEGEDFISVAGSASTETLFSVKINWDTFRELGKHPLKQLNNSKNSHTRNSSESSNTSELGTTMKELFGPLKYYESAVPLASSETLSEISSMSSRASFAIRDKSPLLAKLKLGKNLSLRNGSGSSQGDRERHDSLNGESVGMTTSRSHQRSFSCVYPEGKKVGNIIENPFGTLNGEGGNRHKGGRKGSSESANGHHLLNVNGDSMRVGLEIEPEGDGDLEYYVPFTPQDLGLEVDRDPDQTPTGLPPLTYLDIEFLQTSGVMEIGQLMLREEGQDEEEVAECPEGADLGNEEAEEESSDGGFESAYYVRATGKVQEEKDKEPVEEGERGDYSPTYPVFTTQEEYGPERHRSSYYTYSSQSPAGSSYASLRVMTDNGDNEEDVIL